MKNKTTNGIGRFDLVKGVAMLSIIFWHVSLEFKLTEVPAFFTFHWWINSTLFIGTNAAFFLIAGYSLRKRSPKKMFSIQAMQTLKPYLYTTLAIIFLHLFAHYTAFHYFPGSVQETIRVGGGLLMGLSKPKNLFGISFFACGTGWFILTMFWSCSICNWAVYSLPKKVIFPLFLVAYIFNEFLEPSFPFYCFLKGLGCCIIVYIGYAAKEHKFLDRNNDKLLYLMLLIFAASSVYYLLPATNAAGRDPELETGSFIRNVFIVLSGFVSDLFWGTFFVLLFLKLSAVKNRLLDWISIIGRYSLDVYMVHTVEGFALPWYLFAAKFADRPVLGFFVESVLRCTLIFIVCTGLHYFKFYKRDLFDWTRKKCNRSVSS